jgi:hypothetical protein
MPKRTPIDVEELKKVVRIRDGNLERLNYHYPNGKWTVVENKKNHNKGYCQVWLNGTNILYHVIIWILSTGKDIPQGYELDHINGNKIDSRIENLRLVTTRQNQQNRKKHRAGRLVGATYLKERNYWLSQIVIDKTHIHLGLFETEQEAHEAYKIACKHIRNYVDKDSFRELINKEMEKNNG